MYHFFLGAFLKKIHFLFCFLFIYGLISCSSKEKRPVSLAPSQPKEIKKTVISPYKELINSAKEKKHREILSLVENKLAQNENDKVALNALAMYYYQIKKYDLAEYILKNILRKFPKEGAFYNNMALVQSAKGNLEDAFYWLRQGLRVKSRQKSLLKMHLASLYVEVKDYKAAYSIFASLQRSGKLKGNKNWINYADSLMGVGQTAKAKKPMKGFWPVQIEFLLRLF